MLVVRKKDKIFAVAIVAILALYGYCTFLRLPLVRKIDDMKTTFAREGSVEELRARGDALLGRLESSWAEVARLESSKGDVGTLCKISLKDFGERTLQCGLVLESLYEDEEADNYRVRLSGSWANFCALLVRLREDNVMCRILGLNFNANEKRWEFLLWL